jgi:hypothetical protein
LFGAAGANAGIVLMRLGSAEAAHAPDNWNRPMLESVHELLPDCHSACSRRLRSMAPHPIDTIKNFGDYAEIRVGIKNRYQEKE